ncbi:hypothetical protein NCC49_005308 [Naganishia albida]|nr:hypothetical protein NCC49_005308 [Naganishia albida]
MWSVLIPHIILALSALARPIAQSGKLVRHRSPGWDEPHHKAHYRRWERLDLDTVLQKRDARGGEWDAVRTLFRDSRAGKRSGEMEFEVSMRLLPRDQASIRKTLRDINDPIHPSFRKFLSHEETMSLLSPHDIAVDLAFKFLSSHGIEKRHVETTEDGQTLSFWTSMERANRMFDADFAVHRYTPRSEDTHRTLYQLGTEAYSLPEELAPFVGHINPGNDFRLVRPHLFPATRLPDKDDWNFTMHSNAVHMASPHAPPLVSGLKTCDTGMTPDCLRAIYHMPVPSADSTKGVSSATLNLRPFMSNPDDLKAGFKRYGGGRIPATYLPEKIDIKVPGVTQSTGEPNPSEPDLDLEIMVPLVYPMKVYDFQAPSLSAMSLYGSVGRMGQAGYPRPDVLSVSYGATECSWECLQYYCDMTNGPALEGTTLLASSGDNGNQDIQDPGVCPHWISVGATQTQYGGWAFDSAGGFSTGAPQPEWQVKAIEAYNKKYTSDVFGFLQGNAGVPDLSAQGKEFVIAITLNGAQDWYAYGGTSASTPVASSMMALINGALKQQDAPLLGSPLATFYANKTLFRDVVTGDNNNDGFSGDWVATSGWDPASGLGTPLYNRILAAFS